MKSGSEKTTFKQANSEGCQCTGCPSADTKKKHHAFSFFVLALVGGIVLVTIDISEKYQFDLQSETSLTMVFILGLLTGAHCIGMCGGFMLSYLNFGKENGLSHVQSHLRYAIAKTLSYTFLGGLFGLFGAGIYLSTGLKARISIIGGIILIYLGAKAFRLIPRWKKHFSSPKKLGRLSIANPIYVGLLNGLMLACGPLQAMYLVSAGLGEPFYGMLLLFVFALGTLPLFLFYGVIIGKIKNLKSKWPDRITATIVVVFGILMINRGLALGGINFHHSNETTHFGYKLNNDAPQIIEMNATKKGWGADELYFEKGRKIKWMIHVEELTLCNKTIEIPQLALKIDLKLGDNLIEFDPGNHQKLTYTCWMGMMTGEFIAKNKD